MSKPTRTIAASKSGSAETQSVDSSARSARPPKKKPKKRANAIARKSKAPAQPKAKPLPPPVDVPLPGEQSPLVQAIDSQSNSSPTSLPSSPDSSIGSQVSSNEPLAPEAERLLASIPETIADLGPEPISGATAGISEPEEHDAIAALIQQIAFETEDVQDQVCELFEWLAERFRSDHWKLTDRQARMLGRPTAQLLNSLWTRLQIVLPGILARWCQETPGATAFMLACGIVVVPKVTKQVGISRARQREGSAKRMVREGTSHGAPKPQQVPRPPANAGGMIYTQGV